MAAKLRLRVSIKDVGNEDSHANMFGAFSYNRVFDGFKSVGVLDFCWCKDFVQ